MKRKLKDQVLLHSSGELEDSEQEELLNTLSCSDEAQELLDTLSQLKTNFQELPELEPSQDLVSHALDRVRMPGWIFKLFSLQNYQLPALAMAAAVVFLVVMPSDISQQAAPVFIPRDARPAVFSDRDLGTQVSSLRRRLQRVSGSGQSRRSSKAFRAGSFQSRVRHLHENIERLKNDVGRFDPSA